jgi:hypothetical protein
MVVPVGKVGSATIAGSSFAPRHGPASRTAAASPQRALVRLAPDVPPSDVSVRPAEGRTAAPFLAHLIATVQGAPQTRERRRADPNRAITAYTAAMHIPESAGQAVRESR